MCITAALERYCWASAIEVIADETYELKDLTKKSHGGFRRAFVCVIKGGCKSAII